MTSDDEFKFVIGFPYSCSSEGAGVFGGIEGRNEQ
jgi:hypothetical protein